jgi:hypothetical protein
MAPDRLQQNAQANTDLLQAALDSNIEGINTAAALGADVNFVDAQGRFALYMSAAQHDMEIIDRLLQLNANTNTRGADGHTALYAAAAQGHEDIVRRLLTWGMTDAVDMGEAAVLAAQQGNLKLCARILAHLCRECSSCWRCAGMAQQSACCCPTCQQCTMQYTVSGMQYMHLCSQLC